ncbi:MAG: dihydrofolate reductase family protein [Methanomassiliicoccaceae archaeon]|jgi:2,5-diamino-6-(ribosylamino)-4(3H)-pyrimidinone 5'-phosphate reductase|nr:dihydrofolate reductase family protein [Methanomassiliicoccaceae archaeon]
MKKRPFIHVNCAMSADGKIAGSDRKQVRISSDEDLSRARELRKRYDAVLVGIGTIIADDPHLTIKGASFYNNPIRIVIDPHGRTPKDAQVIDGRSPTLILTDDDCTEEWGTETETIKCGSPFSLAKAMELLAGFGIERILIEGGGKTIASFFKEGFVDKYSVFVGGLLIGGRDSPTPVDGEGWICENGLTLKLKSAKVLGNGVLITYDVR